MIGTRRDPNIVRATIPEAKTKPLGRIAGHDYLTFNGTEYAADSHPGNPEDFARQAGELFVMRVVRELIDGSAFERHQTHRAVPVPSGTHAALEAKASKRAAARAAEKPYLPVDALSVVSVLARKPERRAIGNWEASLLVIPGRPALRGPKAIIEYLGARGLRLQATPDGSGVLVYAKGDTRGGRLDAGLREAIRATARLLAGELTGNPILCELCRGKDRQPAITIAEVDVAVCEQHASEELQA